MVRVSIWLKNSPEGKEEHGGAGVVWGNGGKGWADLIKFESGNLPAEKGAALLEGGMRASGAGGRTGGGDSKDAEAKGGERRVKQFDKG